MEIFRNNTFGNEVWWTDTARMHEVITSAVTPAVALRVGLKVDVDALPPAVQEALAAGKVDLNSTATTITLLKLNAVLGLHGTVVATVGGDSLAAVGITCALCHSSVDNSFAAGVGHRKDGWANTDLNPGAIVALSPAIPQNLAPRTVAACAVLPRRQCPDPRGGGAALRQRLRPAPHRHPARRPCGVPGYALGGAMSGPQHL